MNEYDSYIITKVLQDSGFMVEVFDLYEANILILNTCSVREKARDKIYSELGMWKKLKDIRNNIIICVGGCVASLDGYNIFKRAPYVDVVFGPQTLDKLVHMIDESLLKKSKVIDNSFSGISKFNNVFSIDNVKGISSYLTVAEGCSKYCSYCIVPYSRGHEISRSFNSIMSEVYVLAMQGVKEIILLGQNVSSYLGLINSNSFANLSLLIGYINNIDEISRIKFISPNPLDFDDFLISSYEKNYKLSNHLHLPLQSGSNKILNLMKRGYAIEDYRNIICKLKKIRNEITISTDIIVGFPGESNNDFQDTVDFVSEMFFDMSFVYVYSPRLNTLAFNMKDDVSLSEKKRRLNILNGILIDQSNKITNSMLGTVQRVLFYKYDNGKLIGKTDNNRVVILSENHRYVGKSLNVLIKEKNSINLSGNLV